MPLILSALKKSPKFNPPRLILLLILLILMGLSVYAARWQWQRAQYHEALLTQRLQQTSNKTIDLNHTISPTQLGQIVSVTGRWLPNSTTYVSPRILNGIRGALVISIFTYVNANGNVQHIAVHRGWAIQTEANSLPELPPLPETTIQLKGEWINRIPQSFELKKIAINQLGLWQNYSLLKHAELTRTTLSPYILSLSPDSPDAQHMESIQLKRALPRAVTHTLSEKAAKNRGYMVQWLGLFIVGLIGLLVLFRQRFN